MSSFLRRLGRHSSSRTRMGPQRLAGNLKRCYGLIATDGREVVKKVVEPITGLKIVDEGLHRDAGAREDRGAPQDFGVGLYDSEVGSHNLSSCLIVHGAKECQV